MERKSLVEEELCRGRVMKRESRGRKEPWREVKKKKKGGKCLV